MIQSAEAQKASRIAEAEGQVARFNAMYEQYALNPLITKQRMFYEAMEEILPGVKIIINNDEAGTTQRMYLGDLDGSFTDSATSDSATSGVGATASDSSAQLGGEQ